MLPRIVLDTNVMIAALLSSRGKNRDALRACLREQARPLMGAALLHEYEDVMRRDHLFLKCPLSARERGTLLEAFLSVCEWVKVYYLWRPNLSDEGDNHLIELAIAGAAEMIVTNNIKDFQHSGLRFPHLQIVTPTQFIHDLP
jgi:putative PIN family toxin of toxin-antitoxin system